MMMIRRGKCPVREEIVYGGNCVRIRRFKRGEKRGLIIGRIGKLEIDVWGCRIWRREIGWFEEFVWMYGKDWYGGSRKFLSVEKEWAEGKVMPVFLSRYSLMVGHWGWNRRGDGRTQVGSCSLSGPSA